MTETAAVPSGDATLALLRGQQRASAQLRFLNGMREAGMDHRRCTRVFEEVVSGANTGRIVGLVCDGRTFWLKKALPYPWLPEWTPELSGGPEHPHRLIYPEEPKKEEEKDGETNEEPGPDTGSVPGAGPRGAASAGDSADGKAGESPASGPSAAPALPAAT